MRLVELSLMGFASAFLPWDEKQTLIEQVKQEIREIEAPKVVR